MNTRLPVPAMHRDHPVLVVAHLAGVRERRALRSPPRRRRAPPARAGRSRRCRCRRRWCAAGRHARAPARSSRAAPARRPPSARQIPRRRFPHALRHRHLGHRDLEIVSLAAPIVYDRPATASTGGHHGPSAPHRRLRQGPRQGRQFLRDQVFEFKEVGRETIEIGSAIYMSDGVINMALLNFAGAKGQRPRRPEEGAVGANHFGFQVDDLVETQKRIEAARRQVLLRPRRRAARQLRAQVQGPGRRDVRHFQARLAGPTATSASAIPKEYPALYPRWIMLRTRRCSCPFDELVGVDPRPASSSG